MGQMSRVVRDGHGHRRTRQTHPHAYGPFPFEVGNNSFDPHIVADKVLVTREEHDGHLLQKTRQ